MSRNPYHHESTQPKLRQSVFVFMDILGYTEMILNSQNNGTEAQTLVDLHSALSAGRTRLEGKDLPKALQDFSKKEFFALKAFTDNIVIGWPVHSDAEVEFGRAFMYLAEFQFNMAIRGYFVRGAISVGPAFIDEIAVFGSALTDAYIGESKLARDPRIILTRSVVTATQQHLKYYHPPSHAPHVRDLLKDSDGQWFLNYLEAVMIAEHEHGPFYEEFLLHKVAVERRLMEHTANPTIWAKYAWVASYHNYFCDLHSNYFNDEHRVDVELFKTRPSLITDET